MKDSFEFQLRSILELFDKEISNQVSRDKRHIKQYREDSINLGYIKLKFKKTQFEWNPKNFSMLTIFNFYQKDDKKIIAS